MTSRTFCLLVLAVALLATGRAAPGKEVTSAICHLRETTASAGPVTGSVTLTKNGAGNTEFTWNINGLSPGEHSWHVHAWGDILTDDGLAVGGHLIGTGVNRPAPTPIPTELGQIGNGHMLTADAGGASVSAAPLEDTFIKLEGVNSVIGRGIIIHGIAGNASPRVAQCVIGIATESATDAADVPTAPAAACRFSPVAASGTAIDGSVKLSPFSSAAGERLRISYVASGLPASTALNFRLYSAGNLAAPGTEVATTVDRLTTGSPLCVGNAATCNVLGRVGNTGSMMTSAGGVAVGSIEDAFMTLGGDDRNILGRSLVLLDGTTQLARCVIGYALTQAPAAPSSVGERAVPQVTAATCQLSATEGSPNDALDGVVNVALQADGSLRFDWAIAGLAAGAHAWHIHQWGNTYDLSGSSPGGHFGVGATQRGAPCVSACDELATIADTGVITTPAAVDVGGGQSLTPLTRGFAIDDKLTLNGNNSIVGRGIVIHGNGTDGAVRVAQCTIGRAFGGERSTLAVDHPVALSAIAMVHGIAGQPAAGGLVTFDALQQGVAISWFITGLAPGRHTWHIHVAGDTTGVYGAFVGGHFIGTSTREEVALIGGDGVFYADANGVARGSIVDPIIELNGVNGVIGRGIIVHGDGVSASPRVAQAAIGASRFLDDVRAPAGTGETGGNGDNDGNNEAAASSAFAAPGILLGIFCGLSIGCCLAAMTLRNRNPGNAGYARQPGSMELPPLASKPAGAGLELSDMGSSAAGSRAGAAASSAAGAGASSEKETCVVLYSKTADGKVAGELDIVKGEKLTIVAKDTESGWWEGTNAAGKTGLFPGTYVQVE